LIDWVNLGVNSLWILGLAVFLASASLASWEATRRGERFLVVLDSTGYVVAISLGLGLFCVSLAICSPRAWERWLWVFLGTGLGAQAIWAVYRMERSDGP